MLRDKLRSLAQECRCYRDTREDSYQDDGNSEAQEGSHADLGTSDDLEFNVTEDVLNFFETSERHKREMRRKHGSGRACKDENSEEIPFVNAAEIARARKEEAELLYGDSGSKILAMETALRSTIEQHEDTANPQYWPNIPLKP